MQGKIIWRGIFLGVSENENICGFPLRSDRWKNLMRQKPAYIYVMRAAQNENFLVLPLEKIPKYSIISKPGNLVE